MKHLLASIVLLVMVSVGCKEGTKLLKQKGCPVIRIEKPKIDSSLFHVPDGTIFYVRWGYTGVIRRYKTITSNDNGYFVKWQDAGPYDSKSIEFMPKRIVLQPEFKILSK